MKRLFPFLLLILLSQPVLHAQEILTQTVRGTVTDRGTQLPLIGANIVLLDSEPLRGTTTDINGRFRIEEVPLGRQSLLITYVGYQEQRVSNIEVGTGKEVVLNIELEEKAFMAKEITIVVKKDKKEANNEMATVSARQFSVEETQRYAGARGDVSRMAANFAGVSGSDDSRNDIIIRGNSPLGLLWRLEGVDIPNPNHFGGFGTTGGPVSMLNNNLLTNSDFLTGAFPAEYGNAVAGAFDLKMRNGNNEKREYLLQMGFNGLEAGAEGPINRGKGSSYLANYRYSTLGIFELVGINFGVVGIPQYQDLTLKLNFPQTKLGSFSLFGLGGISWIEMLDSERDPDEWDFNLNGTDTRYGTQMGVVGLNHIARINTTTWLKTTLSISGQSEFAELDSVERNGLQPSPFFRGSTRNIRQSLALSLNKKFSAHFTTETGVRLNRISFKTLDSVVSRINNRFVTTAEFDGSTYTLQPFVQGKFAITEHLDISGGIASQFLLLNNAISAEPRVGMKYRPWRSHAFGLAFGIHSQMQPLQVYFTTTEMGNGTLAKTNMDLDFTYSNHYIFSYDFNISESWRLKSEWYYQDIYNVPVMSRPDAFSMLNFGADFGLPFVDSLENNGSGLNYGTELTIEKFFSNNYYLLFTGSFFESKYRGSDNILRNTAFNYNYILNLLGGYELKIGQNNFLAGNVKVSYAGGRNYTPINLEESAREGRAVYNNDLAYSEQYDPFFKTNVLISFRNNKKKYSQEWILNVENIFNTQNILTLSYDPQTQQVRKNYQLGLFIVPQYRIEF
ncbi:MAG: TonB-dependent receptor [Bacteroidia bacterium]